LLVSKETTYSTSQNLKYNYYCGKGVKKNTDSYNGGKNFKFQIVAWVGFYGSPTKGCNGILTLWRYTTRELVEFGWKEEKAREFYDGTIVFPHIKKKKYPSKKNDGKLQQHFNLSQILNEVETNFKINLDFDYT